MLQGRNQVLVGERLMHCGQYNADFPVAVLSHHCSSYKTELSLNTPTPAAGHTEHVQTDRQAGQGDPMYEDPHLKNTGVSMELEENVAYNTTDLT